LALFEDKFGHALYFFGGSECLVREWKIHLKTKLVSSKINVSMPNHSQLGIAFPYEEEFSGFTRVVFMSKLVGPLALICRGQQLSADLVSDSSHIQLHNVVLDSTRHSDRRHRHFGRAEGPRRELARDTCLFGKLKKYSR
jgi:hypothetical protein